jgi:phosphopentomutase
VIARPFRGEPGAFERTPGRRDFALEPPRPTLLDVCEANGVPVTGVGKIGDVFSMRGVTESRYSDSDGHGIDLACRALALPGPRLVFLNLVDFDSKYGHRNDAGGFAANLERFDAQLPRLQEAVGDGIGFITGDHGCDPTTPSTDHSRETVPVLVWGCAGGPIPLGTRSGMGDLGATIADLLGLDGGGLQGRTFASSLR